MILIHGLFIVLILSIQYVLIEGKTFYVSNYGAYPNDTIDDGTAIQNATIAAILYGSNSILVFDSGTYLLSTTIYIYNANNLTIIGQGKEKTLLLGITGKAIFSATYCTGIKFSFLSIDYDPLPFTAGYIINVNDNYLDVQIISPHRADINQQVQAIHRFDPIEMRPAFGPNTYEIYQVNSSVGNTSLISPGILRIPLLIPSKFLKEDPIVARYAFRELGIYGQDSTDFIIQSINMYTSYGFGIGSLRLRRVNINDFHILSINQRWMSVNMDCIHLIDSREYINLINSSCHLSADDGLNVHGTYFSVTKILNQTTIVLQTTGDNGQLDIGIGTRLEFSSYEKPFTISEIATIATSIVYSSNERLFIFTNPINVNIKDWACVFDTPLLSIQNYTVENNRARGILLETRHVEVRQCLFNRTSASAIYIQPSLLWYEGPVAYNVTLTENIYINCNEGIGQLSGVINLSPYPNQLIPVIEYFHIKSSTFINGIYSQAVLHAGNTNHLLFIDNYIATNTSTPLISICNSRSITAMNNCVINNQSKINQYYIFDKTFPCFSAFSSSINLPASAFNSSFPPPV